MSPWYPLCVAVWAVCSFVKCGLLAGLISKPAVLGLQGSAPHWTKETLSSLETLMIHLKSLLLSPIKISIFRRKEFS